MRLNINLASQKYEDVRKFYLRWSTAIGLAALLAVLLIGLAVMNSFSSSKSSQRIKELKQQVAFLEKQRAAAEAVSNLPENHDVNAQKNYWNKQINRRQLSWTQLFNDLQRIMPARSYLSSVRPEITPDNRLKLTLTIMGDTHENALELEKKMEKSERFRGPIINGEGMQLDQKSGTQLWKFEIVTYYAAAGTTQGHASSKEGL
jgi:Tfp pilus assembly protein PilN